VAADLRTGLLIDWGGVMTTSLFHSFEAFCAEEGLDPAALSTLFRTDPQARRLLIDYECGRVADGEFETRLGAALGARDPEGLVDRLMAGAGLDEAMADVVRRARRAGVRTGLVSNSWGTTRYPRALLAELFDALVISGEEGFRKPDPRMYELGAQRIGRAPEACVFVDDLPFNLEPAIELGMAVIHHASAPQTVSELERLLGLEPG
jgi:epoxide hydrolase-like predicted phosphatase